MRSRQVLHSTRFRPAQLLAVASIVLGVALPAYGQLAFRRGDCNGDGILDISDPLSNLAFQFAGTFTPMCKDALDYNDDGNIDISDPVGSLSFQFAGTGDPPAPPGSANCGSDPTPEAEELGCEEYTKC